MPKLFSPEPLRIQVGMLLSGCGHYDGTDVQEAVLCGWVLDRSGARVVGLAPTRSALHVVDHTVGEEIDQSPRSLLLESARLFHERVHPVPGYPLETLQALVVPGGFGAAKNLMTAFARPGEKREVHPEAAAVIRHFLAARKPVGLIGLGEIPVRALLALPLEDSKPAADPREIGVDRERRMVTTPGYKTFSRTAQVAIGIEAMVVKLVEMMREQ